jgi:hypothetical protein
MYEAKTHLLEMNVWEAFREMQRASDDDDNRD